MGSAYIAALAESFTVESLRERIAEVALLLATRATRNVEINLKRVDGRESSGIVVSTYDEKIAFLTAARAAVARIEGTSLPESSGKKTDFSLGPVDC